MAPEFSKGKTLVVLAIVIACFAILWPKVFYSEDSVASTTVQQQPPIKEREPAGALCCGVVFESDASSMAFLNELCSQVLKNRDGIPPDRTLSLCHHELMNKCGIDLEDVVKSDVDGAVVDRRLSSKFHGRVRAQNLTTCLEINFGIDENLVRAKKSYHRPSDVLYPRHMRPERPPHLHPDMMHPALREKGRVIPPTRTIEKQAKPGPMPGMRPPMGGAPHIVSPSQGSGGMGILMPIYTIGIIVFFLYTMMKIMFKKPASEDETVPRIKDFHMDGEHRKYLFAEEYCTGVAGGVSEMSVKEYAILQEQQRQLLLQEQRRSRSKTPEVFAKKDEEPILEHVCQKTEVVAEQSLNKSEPAPEDSVLEEIVEEEIIPRSPKMDTDGKPIGQWYLPPGFTEGPTASDDENETGSDDIDLNDADERSLRLAFAALKAQKEEEVDQLRRRLEETERAMERICRQMGDVTDKLSTSAVADLLTPQLSSDKTNEELADENDQECKPCPLEEQVSIPEEGTKDSPLSEPVKIAVLQSSQEIQDPVEEEFIRTATTESESFLRSFVRRLPSERQPSEMEEDVATENTLSATSASVAETVQERECQPQVGETVEEKLISEIESVKEEINTQEEQSQVEIEEVVEAVLKCEVESAREPVEEDAVEIKSTPEIECVEEHSLTQEEVVSQPHTEETVEDKPISEIESTKEEIYAQEEERQTEIQEVVEEVLKCEVESARKPIHEDAVEEEPTQETECVQEHSITQEVISQPHTEETTEPEPEVPSVEEHTQEEECQLQVEETVPETTVSEVLESVPKTPDTQEEEITQSYAKETKQSEPSVEEQTQEEECQLKVEETVQESIASQVLGYVPKTPDSQEEEITQSYAEETKQSESEPVEEEEGCLQSAEAMEEVLETKESIQESLPHEECQSQNENTAEETPAPEAEPQIEFVQQLQEECSLLIEKTVEEQLTLHAESPVEMAEQQAEEAECQSQLETSAAEKTTSELESCVEVIEEQVAEEECQLPADSTAEEKTCEAQSLIESVHKQPEEEECQVQTEAIDQEEPTPVAESRMEFVQEPTQDEECNLQTAGAVDEQIIFEIEAQIECLQDPVQEEESETKETVEEVPQSEVESVQETLAHEESAIQIEEAVKEQPVPEIESAFEQSFTQEEEVSQSIEETPQSEPKPLQEPQEESNIEEVETVKEVLASESAPMNEYIQEEECQNQIEETVEPVQETSEECNSEEVKTVEDALALESEPVNEYVQEEACPAQIHETVEELHISTVESVQETVEEEEGQFRAEETVEEKSANECGQEMPGKQEEEHKSQMEETELIQELTNSEEGESSLMDGETIEEILESEMESIHDLTIGEDEKTNIEDITEDGLDIETDYVTEIPEMPTEEIPVNVEQVSVVEEVPETQVESNLISTEVVLQENQSKVEEIAIATPCSKLKLEEANVKNTRQGSEERRMTVNVCGMDVTACMEDCGKMPTDMMPKVTEKHHVVKHEHHDTDRVISVFLDTSIRPDSHLVVSEAECSAEIVPPEQLDLDETEYETSPVVLSGKMTLSVIGMELNAESPEIQEEPLYTVEEPDAPRVRFSEPTDRIFLIPVDPEEEMIPDDSYSRQDDLRTEEEDEQIENLSVAYRPPTPPLQHLDDNGDTEFLTYDQLEEVGEVDVPAEETEQEYPQETPIAKISVPETLMEEPTETAVCSEDSTIPETELPVGVDQSLIDAVESQIVSAEEKEALKESETYVPDVSDYVENTEVIPAVDEHASIGEMVEKIRVATEESLRKLADNMPSVEESVQQDETKFSEDETFESSKIVTIDKDVIVDECVPIKTPEAGRSIQSALDDMVDSIITKSIADSVVETLRREECDTLIQDVTISTEKPENVTESLSERRDELPGAEKATLDVEYQILPKPDSASNVEEEDFERNREEEEIEHALEQIEVRLEKQSGKMAEEEVKDVPNQTVANSEDVESEPSISGFIIREDYPDEEETQPMTEEEILQARQEIEEIKKLLADVSSGVVHQSVSQVPTGSSNIVTELAYAMADESASAAAASKGSSPDMDEYEVIQTARPAESSEASLEAAGAITPVKPTSTNNNS